MTDLSTTSECNSNSSELPKSEEQQPSPEFLQRKIYFIVDQLRKMHAELPENLQTRISYDLLTELANCVLNESIFEIVRALTDLQNFTEKHLMQLRTQVQNEYEIEVADWRRKINDPDELEHILMLMNMKHTKKLLETDKQIIQTLDQKVTDQQSTLQKAGVPGFYVTQQPKEIKIQMFLLDFLLRLSRLEYKPNK